MNQLPVNAAIKVRSVTEHRFHQYGPFSSSNSVICICKQVEWQESACSFTATVQSANPDGTYDVVYDEKVDGKSCIEKSVVKERIEQQQVPTVVSDYWMDDEEMQEALPTVSPVRAKKPKEPTEGDRMQSDDDEDQEAFQSAPQRSKLISKLISVSKLLIIYAMFQVLLIRECACYWHR